MVSSPMRSSDDGDHTLEITLSQMAALVETHLAGAIEAFERRDIASAESLITADKRVDDMHAAIEQHVMDALSEGPFDALRLREIMMIMKVSGELERVGDLAKNVAKRTLVVSREKFVRPSLGVNRMGRSALRQFSYMLNAYASRNLEAAKAVWGGDDELDELYNSVFKEIIVNMMEDREHVNACTQIVFIAKNFERVGDHATNIAEALHYFITGEPLAEERPKGDETSVTKVAPPEADD